MGAVTVVVLVLAGHASAATFYSEVFYSGDSRGYTSDGNWGTSEYKGECNSGDPVSGVSSLDSNTGSSLLPHALLCNHGTYSVGYGTIGALGTEKVHSLMGGGDDRGDTGTGDWDSGFWKAECNFDEVVIGVAEKNDGSHKISKILCAWISSELDANESNCHKLSFSLTSDNRRSTSGGDWDSDHSKNQCGDSEVLKGISTNQSTGEIHAILCCANQPYPH